MGTILASTSVNSSLRKYGLAANTSALEVRLSRSSLRALAEVFSPLDSSADTSPYQSCSIRNSASRVRAWSPDQLRAWLEARGFEEVRVSGKLDDPDAAATGEDVFASMRVRG